MLRWRLSTVRSVGGHDNNPRLSSFLALRALEPSRSQFNGIPADPAAGLAQKLNIPVPTSSSAQSHLVGPQDMSSLQSKHCTVARFGANDIAIDTLRVFLSSDNATSDRPLIYSPTTIRSLYYRAESRNQLRMLDSRMLTLLISLFGSLSTDSDTVLVYKVPLASHISEISTRRTHWAFVRKVGKYKSESGMPLHDSDRFWLMRAELAVVQASSPVEPPLGAVYSAVQRARTHYHAIRRHSRRREVHAYYLETLLAIPDTRLLNLVAHDLAFLLRTHHVCYSWLQRLLYRLVIRHGGFLSTRSQEAILTALWSRICRGTDETSDLVHENGSSYTALGSDNCNSDASSAARSTSAALFGPTGYIPNDKVANKLDHLLSAFCPAYALPLRWGSLILFSIFNSSEMLPFSGPYWTNDHVIPEAALYWQVTFGLATVEKLLQDPLSAPELQAAPTENFIEMAHALFQQWSSVEKSCSTPRDLARAITTSFFKIASILADAALFDNCRELYHMEDKLKGPKIPVSKSFIAQYITAAVRVQDPLQDVVFEALKLFSPGPEQEHQILASVVKVLAPIDVFLAHRLYIIAQSKGVEVDPMTTHALAMSFAKHGALREAVLFLNDGRFSLEARGILLSAIARSLRENPRSRHPSSALIAIANELVVLNRSYVPPGHFRGHLEQLLVVLSQHGRGSQLFRVVLSIFGRSPGFFRPRFFDRYCRALVRHRQFSTASKLMDAITTTHPKIVRSLRILTRRVAIRTKGSLVFRCTPLRGPTSLQLSSRLRRPHTGPPLEDELQDLLRSGRVLAAKHVFACVAAAIPSNRCTALGNILLHGVALQPTPRNGRRVRKILALLEKLVENHGFQPDRVTVNILLKAMIDWRAAFDSARLRELFDQLVRGGYPAADYTPLHPPFGTRQTQFSGSSSFSKLPPLVSFEKHSRPLFKMFVKAFYFCNDVEAARKVVGILKVEEYKHTLAKEVRQDARLRGRIRAAQGNVNPLDNSTVT